MTTKAQELGGGSPRSEMHMTKMAEVPRNGREKGAKPNDDLNEIRGKHG